MESVLRTAAVVYHSVYQERAVMIVGLAKIESAPVECNAKT
jgi:hypothetical protein